MKAWQDSIADAEYIEELPRTPDEIGEAIGELKDKIWYTRSYLELLEEGSEGKDPERWKKVIAEGERVRQKYGEENLDSDSEFEWGMLHGKLSALRWVFGDEWDYLDT